MSSIKFNTLVIFTASGEILDVLVGSDALMLSQLKERSYWEEMLEDCFEEGLDMKADNVQNLSDFYQANKHNESLVVRVSYFPNKVVFHK